MQLKQIVSLEAKREDRVYTFNLPHGAPLGEAYDVAFGMLNQVVEMSKNAVAQVAPQDITESD